MRIVHEAVGKLEEYSSIPIRFMIESRVCLDELIASDGRVIVVEPMDPRWKDYDSFASERPTALAHRFDMSKWGILAAFEGEVRTGGAIVAHGTPSYELLAGRPDTAALVDIRVHPEWHGKGVGRTLFEAAWQWAVLRGCTSMIVETQDTNVAACRFYRAMGCLLESADPTAYGDMDEARLIWRKQALPRG